MNFRLTLGLLIVLLVLGGAVYYVESSPATPTPATQSTTVLSFLPSDVSKLEASGQGKSVVVTRDDSGWLLKQPEEARADQMRVDNLVSRLGTLAATRTIDAPSSLAEFGLDKPQVQAVITLKSGQTSTLLLGNQNPDKTSYYAKLPDKGAVYLIPVAVGGDLSRLLTDPPKATPTPTPLPPISFPTGTPVPSVSPAAGSPAQSTPAQVLPPMLTPPAAPVPAATPVPATSPAAGTPTP